MLPALFVSLVLLVAAAKKGKCLGRCGASSGHTTKLKQSVSLRYLWYYQGTERPAFIKANIFSVITVEVLFMEPRNVWNMIKEKSTTFLILDLRDTDDFKASHLK